jgi:small subunit ribosomal protein S15
MVIPHWVNQQNISNGSSFVKLPFRKELVGLSSRITQSLVHESSSKDQMQLLNASVLRKEDLQQGRDIMQQSTADDDADDDECKLPLFDKVMKKCDDELVNVNVNVNVQSSAKDELKFRKERLIKEFQQHEDDNGTIGVQAAVLTLRIRNMILHLFQHQQDTRTRVLCDELIQRRRKKMDYLRRVDFQKYMELCRNLGLKYA